MRAAIKRASANADGVFQAGGIGIRSGVVDAAVRAAAGSAFTQGVGVAAGLQSKFDFAGVATAGVGSLSGSFVGSKTQFLGKFGSSLAGNTAGGIANAATRSAINGESFGDNLKRALPDVIGNTVGNIVAGELGGAGAPQNLLIGTPYEGSSVSRASYSDAIMSQESLAYLMEGFPGGGILSNAGAVGIASGQLLPDAPVTFVGPAASAEEYELRARQWDAVSNDPLYQDIAATNAAFNRSQAANFANSGLAVPASDNLSVMPGVEAGNWASGNEWLYAQNASAPVWETPVSQSLKSFSPSWSTIYGYGGRNYSRTAYYGHAVTMRTGPSSMERRLAWEHQQDTAILFSSNNPGGLGLGDSSYIATRVSGGSVEQAQLAQGVANALEGMAMAGALAPRVSRVGGRGAVPQINTVGNVGPGLPREAYNRSLHYGRTPTAADRAALGVSSTEVVDHIPPLVRRYYLGDPSVGERPGWQMTAAERAASAADRTRMARQSREDSVSQGGQMAAFSRAMKRKYGL